MDWETLDKGQIDQLMGGKKIAPPKAVRDPAKTGKTSIAWSDPGSAGPLPGVPAFGRTPFQGD
ncbi:hypothetical protein A1507_00605 [Methylomonas koyamae]|uniref:Uncharacterized protein n=1 Tax=Methylomonas koyamae TaxID=702114 RepID=A0A177NLQ2_9GAMM|nr:hypothetical protein A1507_00605 [Methylomonas koyamae]